jgi:hypothetical protein
LWVCQLSVEVKDFKAKVPVKNKKPTSEVLYQKKTGSEKQIKKNRSCWLRGGGGGAAGAGVGVGLRGYFSRYPVLISTEIRPLCQPPTLRSKEAPKAGTGRGYTPRAPGARRCASGHLGQQWRWTSGLWPLGHGPVCYGVFHRPIAFRRARGARCMLLAALLAGG